MDADGALLRQQQRCQPNKAKQRKSPVKKNLSDSENDEVLYSYDYITGAGGSSTDRSAFSDIQSRGDAKKVINNDENGLSFVRLLKKELSKKKIHENGSVTEEYKDNYFRLVETNQTLAKNVDAIKTKIKQYKHAMDKMGEEHDELIKEYKKKLEEFKVKIVKEKVKHEEEQRMVLYLRNDIRDVHKKIEAAEGEIVRTIEARMNTEVEIGHKECELVALEETHSTMKHKLWHMYKEMDVVREKFKQFNRSKKQFQEKVNFLLNTNEKIKSYFENLLLDNETLKLENKALERVLKAHENICLELLRIAADKVDSHNDTKTLNELTTIMTTLDANKENYARHKQKLQIKRQKIPAQCFNRKELEKQDDDNQEEYHEAVGYHDGQGDSNDLEHLLNELKLH